MNTTAKINQDKITLLTRKGMKELKKAISRLECERHKIIHFLHESDKTLIHDDRLIRSEKLAELEIIESELDDKMMMLSTSKLMPKRKSNLRVAIGSVVDLIDRHGHLFRYRLVESVEANPSEGKISDKSPIGHSLIGKTVRDIVEWSNGKSTNRLHLIKIT